MDMVNVHSKGIARIRGRNGEEAADGLSGSFRGMACQAAPFKHRWIRHAQ